MMRTFFMGLVLMSIGSIAAPIASAQPTTTALELTVVGGPSLNPNAQGNARPVIVRIFDLKSAAGFESADYQSLFESPSDTVKRDIIAMEEIVVRPGAIQERNRNLADGVRVLGVAAAFRDMGAAVWHLAVPIKPGQRNFLLIHLDRNRIRVETPDSK
jgi:type VI secretion system protein VasD